MTKIEQAVILCAGKGERMGAKFRDIQKCTLIISGEPVIKQIVDIITSVGIKEILLLTGHEAEQVKRCFKGTSFEKNVRYIFCGDPYKTPLIMFKTLAMAEQFISGPFISIHGNILFDSAAVIDLLKIFQTTRPFMAASVARKNYIAPHSRLEYTKDLMVIKAMPPDLSNGDAHMGIDIFPIIIFQYFRDESIFRSRDLINRILLENKEIRVAPYLQEWIHIATPADLLTYDVAFAK